MIRDLASIEHEIALKDQDSTFLMRMIPYRTVDNVIDGVVMTFVDITDRKRHEHERGMLSAIVNSSFDAIIGHTLEGTVTSWNRAAETMFGYEAADIIGKPMATLFPTGRLHEAEALSKSIGQGEVMTSFDTELVRKNGGHRGRHRLAARRKPRRASRLGIVRRETRVLRDRRSLRSDRRRFRNSASRRSPTSRRSRRSAARRPGGSGDGSGQLLQTAGKRGRPHQVPQLERVSHGPSLVTASSAKSLNDTRRATRRLSGSTAR